MTLFILLAAVLLALVLALIVPPLWKKRGAGASDAEGREANLAVFRNQIAELERERDEGSLAAAEFEQAQGELRRRLLEEVSSASAPAPKSSTAPSRKTAIALAFLIPLLAAAGYTQFGTPRAFDPLVAAQAPTLAPEKIQGMIDGLSKHLQDNPGDTESWLMLARANLSLERHAEAAAAYAKVEDAMGGDPDYLTSYADLLAMLAGGKLSGKPLDLIEKALRIKPDHVLGLWLAGTAAYNRNDYAGAAGYWERAIKVLPPDSDDARMLGDSAAEAKRRATLKIDPAQTVAGKVELSPKLATQAAPNDTVFIFARPADGTRVPLAVARVRVADLPYAFVLDDSTAMTPERSISGESRVIVEARVSRTGNAVARNGDLQSEALTTRVGERSLRLKIDRIVSRPAPGA